MNNKFIIVAVSVLLIVSLVYGFTSLDRTFQFVSGTIYSIGDLAQAVSKVLGLDFNNRVDYFLPTIDNEATLGTYYDEQTKQMEHVSNKIKSFLPNWITNSDNENIIIKVYPTMYSIELGYMVTNWLNINNTGFGNLDTFKSYSKYSIDKALRLEIQIPNYVIVNSGYGSYIQGVNSYNVYIFIKDNIPHYYITLGNETSGAYSTKLNSFEQYRNETDQSIRLNSEYKQLFNDNLGFGQTYKYDYIIRSQSTDLNINIVFNEFLKGE